MSSDKEPRNKGIVPAGNRELTRYSSRLIQRGLDLAKELNKSEAALKVSSQTTDITTPQKLIWKCIFTLIGHLNVYCVAISPNGQTLVTGSEYSGIKLWDLPTGEFLDTFSELYFLASGSWDNTIKLWNLHTGKLLHTLDAHSISVLSVVISPDGQKLASGHSGGLLDRSFCSINIWELNTRTPTQHRWIW